MGDLRRDPLTGRLVAIAPGRARRPGAGRARIEPATPEELESCPFCEGREARTPPETLALGRGEDVPDAPGWRVRVVPNLYPALERQEVVVHAPRHARTLAELDDAELALVARAWQERRAAVADGYLHALVNEGAAAGSSLAHTHSQLVWMRDVPPAVAAETGEGACALCEPPGADELVVAERDGVVLRAAWAARLPYELVVAPRAHDGDPWRGGLLAAALQLLGEALRRLHAVEGPVPANAWLHAGAHWHLEVLPRLSVLAGLELGAGIYVNTLPPEEAAERLRKALSPRSA